MKRQITVHQCDRCGGDFSSPKDVAMNLAISGSTFSQQIELCKPCSDQMKRFVTGRETKWIGAQGQESSATAHDLPMYAGDGIR